MNEQDMALKLTEVEARAKSNTHQIEECREEIKGIASKQNEIARLATSVEVLATKQQNVETDVQEIKSDVKQIAGKPGKRWDGLVEKIIWAVAAAFVAYLLAHLGM